MSLRSFGNLPPEDQLSELFRIMGQPTRIQILLTIGAREVCVCHLEASLGMRQATISQHLMILREMGLVTSSRSGRNIYYHLTQPELFGLIEQAAHLMGIPDADIETFSTRVYPDCSCPRCIAEEKVA